MADNSLHGKSIGELRTQRVRFKVFSFSLKAGEYQEKSYEMPADAKGLIGILTATTLSQGIVAEFALIDQNQKQSIYQDLVKGTTFTDETEGVLFDTLELPIHKIRMWVKSFSTESQIVKVIIAYRTLEKK